MNDLVEGCRIEGEIALDGQNIFKGMDVNLLRKRVGMVFQKPNPFPMSIYDNIAFGPRTHGIRSKSKLDDIVERSLRNAAIWDECKDRLKKSALGMSGGQQQRVAIARALVNDPVLILADEATGNLDTRTSFEILTLFQELYARGRTIVFVTHNPELSAYSSRTIVLKDGRVIQDTRNEKIASAKETLAALPKNED